MHTSNPGLRRLTPAAPALGAVLVKTAVASALHNAGGHGVRGDAGTVQADASIGLSVAHAHRAAATSDGVRGVAGTAPAAADIPRVRGVAVTPARDLAPLPEVASAARGDGDTPATERAHADATAPWAAIDTASATDLEATDGALPAALHVHTLHSLVTVPLRHAAGRDAVAAVAI